MNPIDEYISKVSSLLDTSQDVFMTQHREELLNGIKQIATDNWMTTGEAILTPQQLNGIYDTIKSKYKDPAWFDFQGTPICMN